MTLSKVLVNCVDNACVLCAISGFFGDKRFHGLVVDLKGLVRHELDIFDNGLRWPRTDMLDRPANRLSVIADTLGA